MQKKTVIITAGGIGTRMATSLPKQFLTLKNKPILQHSIEAFFAYSSDIQILVTLPKDWLRYWEDLCVSNNFKLPHQIVDGGLERFHSIQNALLFAEGELIAIHDGVRPLVDQKTIEATFENALNFGAAIPVLNLKDSIRKLDKEGSVAVLRKDFVLVQTPQTFKSEILKKAYQQDFHDGITDDASLVESFGYPIKLVDGNEFNIKITTPFDLKVAELVLENRI